MIASRSRWLAVVGAVAWAVLSAGTRPARAAYSFYSDLAAFTAATTNATTYVFTGGTNPGTVEARPYVLGPLGFSTFGRTTRPYLTADGLYGADVTYLDTFGPGTSLVIQPQTGNTIYALGFDLGTPDGATTSTVAMDFVPANILYTFPTSGVAGTTTFFGVVSTSPIGQVSLALPAGNVHYDTVRFYTASAVPEPTTTAGVTVVAMGLLGRHRRRAR